MITHYFLHIYAAASCVAAGHTWHVGSRHASVWAWAIETIETRAFWTKSNRKVLHLDLARRDTSGTQWNVIPRTRQIAVHICVCVCVSMTIQVLRHNAFIWCTCMCSAYLCITCQSGEVNTSAAQALLIILAHAQSPQSVVQSEARRNTNSADT